MQKLVIYPSIHLETYNLTPHEFYEDIHEKTPMKMPDNPQCTKQNAERLKLAMNKFQRFNISS